MPVLGAPELQLSTQAFTYSSGEACTISCEPCDSIVFSGAGTSQIQDSMMSRAASSSGFQASVSMAFQLSSPSCRELCSTCLSSSNLISRIWGGAGNSSIQFAASISSSGASSWPLKSHCSFASSSKSHSPVLASTIGDRADSE